MSSQHRRVSTTNQQSKAYSSHSRTWSMASSSSGLSSQSSTHLVIVPDPRLAAEASDKRSAWGSFVPLNSATTSLRAICEPLYDDGEGEYDDESESESEVPYTMTIEKSRPYTSSAFRTSHSHSSPGLPLITRTLTSMPPRPPSPDSSASSINHDVVGRRHPNPNELHPVLARMERASKFCTQKLECTTCRKTGRDFPQCGKCRQMWCSRECRLLGGKRHICSGN